MKRLFRIIIILIVGSFVYQRIIHQADHEDIFDPEITVLICAVVLVTFFCILFYDRKEYISSKKWQAFIPTTLCILSAINLFATLFHLQQLDKSPSTLYCVSKVVDFNGVSIDFREDGTYKLTSWSIGADFYRGSYKITDSIITLDKSSIERVIKSDRLVIRMNEEKDSKGNQEKSIYQIDKNGNVIGNVVDFRVLDKSTGQAHPKS